MDDTPLSKGLGKRMAAAAPITQNATKRPHSDNPDDGRKLDFTELVVIGEQATNPEPGAMVSEKPALYLNVQPPNVKDFWTDKTRLKSLGAAWGPAVMHFTDTPDSIRQGAKVWFVPKDWPASEDAFLTKYASVFPPPQMPQQLVRQIAGRAVGAPAGPTYLTRAAVMEAFADFEPFEATD